MGTGGRIKALRKGKFNQAELAELIGVHETTIRRWEQGRDRGPDLDALKRIADVLNTSVAYLTGETDDPKRYTSSLSELVGSDGNGSSLIASKHGVPGDSEGVARLIYEQDGKRLDLPDTPENRELFEKLVVAMMAGSLKDEASASPRSAGAAKPA